MNQRLLWSIPVHILNPSHSFFVITVHLFAVVNVFLALDYGKNFLRNVKTDKKEDLISLPVTAFSGLAAPPY